MRFSVVTKFLNYRRQHSSCFWYVNYAQINIKVRLLVSEWNVKTQETLISNLAGLIYTTKQFFEYLFFMYDDLYQMFRRFSSGPHPPANVYMTFLVGILSMCDASLTHYINKLSGLTEIFTMSSETPVQPSYQLSLERSFLMSIILMPLLVIQQLLIYTLHINSFRDHKGLVIFFPGRGPEEISRDNQNIFQKYEGGCHKVSQRWNILTQIWGTTGGVTKNKRV